MRNVFLGLLSIFVLHTSAVAADKIRIGFPAPVVQFVPFPLAAKSGFFQEEGLQVEFVEMLPNVGIAALVSGGIDYWTVIGNDSIAGAIRGAPIKIVACYVPSSAFSLISRPEVNSVQELKGKAIGINAFGGVFEAVARLIFKHFGVDPGKEINFLLSGGNQARFASMTQGLTAATMMAPPFDSLGKKMGFVVLARSQELFSYPTSGLVTTTKKIREKPDEVKRVIKVGVRANRYIRQNREGTIRFMGEWMKIDEEMAAAAYESSAKIYNDDGVPPEDGLRFIIEEAKKLAKVSREVSLSEIEDLSILPEVQRGLGSVEK